MGEETEFADGSHYEERAATDEHWRREWHEFERSIREQARLFNDLAASTLRKIFHCLNDHKTSDGKPVVVEAGPGTPLGSFYRARVFQSSTRLAEALKRPDLHMGPPPVSFATAGRMNAQGISVFYGSDNPEAAVSEVRPPVGSRVVIAKFDLLRELKLLDLVALRRVMVSGSLFDPGSKERFEHAAFLRTLCDLVSTPVMPDNEALEYLTTQAVADFLANENDPPLDGLIFPSIQRSGGHLNVVLFHKAARVEELEIPDGTEITAELQSWSDDGPEPDYWVWEEVPRPEERDGQVEAAPRILPVWPDEDPLEQDDRDRTLRVDMSSIEVRHVEAVHVETSIYTVSRHRSEKSEPNPSGGLPPHPKAGAP